LAASLDSEAVRRAYKRWAPVYDYSFGVIAATGRRTAVQHINRGKGKVLEVGVGTGLSLPYYARHLKITGIDLSSEMLDKARERVAVRRLPHVEALYEMDASTLAFGDGTFETVVAMFVMTVVPDPTRVMRELERVCAPGGEVILVNHFSQDHGMRGWVEHKMAPHAHKLGWHPIFPVKKVMVCENLHLIEKRRLFPLGLFSQLRFRKKAAGHQG
jgi:phosphatidylethanolamine/phosphatidyl-N-methylethanolamine N-methyltransferase